MSDHIAKGAVGWQRVEGALVMAACIMVYAGGERALGLWPAALLFFLPDLSFAGYAAGPRIGSVAYNAVHIYGFGAAVLVLGGLLHLPVMVALGVLWIGHVGFDRMLGYGLKLPQGFGFTHMGRIGRR